MKIPLGVLTWIRRKISFLSDNYMVFSVTPEQKSSWICIIFLTLYGCSTTHHVQVVDARPLNRADSQLSHYRVQAGDTLYSIATQHGKDYRELARINRLPEDFRIFPGQILRLDVTSQVSGLRTPVKASKREVSAALVSAPVQGSQHGVKKMPVTLASDRINWKWPVQGPILQGFSDHPLGNKGIDISGKRGEPVLAAADGTVVYRGTGLVGYGRLLIVRHGDRYLSVYAHNDKILVAEGVQVKAGQEIAELGSSGTDRDFLHFEIRVEGHPVDPMTLLPPENH